MKKTLLLLALLTVLLPVKADEGMWLPLLISNRISDMQAKGFKLTAEDIYSVNKASLKDAVVRFGGGCTGEVVSPDGLLFTNHHCGYGQIQEHSTVEHDYLKDGFWAMSKEEELPNPGLTVSFLQSMEDVTERVLKGYVPSMTNGQRDSVIQVNSRVITDAINNQAKGIRSSVEGLYNGNQYFLFVYKIYSDVRLVGAPPSSIGKFGGDTDNWMWPRHTGDFSIFRIYANKDNEPAEYSKDNVPYHPKRYFTISRKGVKEGDFTMVYGTPGTTREYVTSDEVRYTGEISDPEKIALRTMRLDIQKKHFEVVKEGMHRVMVYGTGRHYAVDTLHMAGKTGTVQNPHGRDHAIFIGFAPVEDPKIAVAVVVENAGFGATWACPVATMMIEQYLTGEVKRKDLRKRIGETVLNESVKKW